MAGFTVARAFESAARCDAQSHQRIIARLTEVFPTADTKTKVNDFLEHFINCVKRCLVFKDQRTSVDNALTFCAKFIAEMFLQNSQSEEDSKDDEDDRNEMSAVILKKFWKFLLKSHNVENQTVRYRVCQLVRKIMSFMDEEAQISGDLYAKIQHAMLKRLSDKVSVVRAEAAYALFRLQDSDDEHCPTTKAFHFHIGHDPHPDVRFAIINSVLPTKKSLELVLLRTRDVKDTVRKAAYEFLANRVHVRSLTIAQRLSILKRGLHDRSEIVKKTCKQTLLPSWLKMLEGDLLKLLCCLDVQDASDFTEEVLEEALANKDYVTAFQEFNVLGDDHIIREDAISAEAAFYWRVVCAYFKKQGTAGEEYIEKLLPDLPPFCLFIERYVNSTIETENVMDRLDKEFICQQLVNIASFYDLVDEKERKCIHCLAKHMLNATNFNIPFIESAIKLLKMSIIDVTESVTVLMEVIAELQEPMHVVEVKQTAEELRRIELSLGKVKVEINIARDELEKRVAAQEFDEAKVTKERLLKLEESMAQLIKEKEPKFQEVKEMNNDNTLTKCLLIACELLKDDQLKIKDHQVYSLVETLVLPSVQNKNESVRAIAVKVLGLSCLTNVELAKQHLVLLLQVCQLDSEETRVNALKSVIDILLWFGFEAFKSGASQMQDVDSFGDSEDFEDQHTDILAILLANLDSEVVSVSTISVEGLTRLLFCGRIVSPKIVSKLIILWYNPLSKDNDYVVNCLGVFFPAFAAASLNNRIRIGEAFLPTLRTLFATPQTSPLCTIDVNSVARFMVYLTRSLPTENKSNATEQVKNQSPHDSMASEILKEIICCPYQFGVLILVDALLKLDITQNREIIKKLFHDLHNVKKHLKDSRLLQKINKFSHKIQSSVSQFSSEEESLHSVLETPDHLRKRTESFSDAPDLSNSSCDSD